MRYIKSGLPKGAQTFPKRWAIHSHNEHREKRQGRERQKKTTTGHTCIWCDHIIIWLPCIKERKYHKQGRNNNRMRRDIFNSNCTKLTKELVYKIQTHTQYKDAMGRADTKPGIDYGRRATRDRRMGAAHRSVHMHTHREKKTEEDHPMPEVETVTHVVELICDLCRSNKCCSSLSEHSRTSPFPTEK